MSEKIKTTLTLFIGLPLLVGGIWCIYNNKEIYIAYALAVFLISFFIIGIMRASIPSVREETE